MTRLELFQQALADVELLAITQPTGRPSKSAIIQMRYLVELESGQRTDFERLADINIGLLAIRELQPADPTVEERLCEVDAEAKTMLAQWRRRTNARA